MSEQTKIQWCDHTASPWYGCTHGIYTDADGNEHEHPGCANCYAEKGAKRNPATLGVWGKNGTRVMSASFHANCRRWNAAAAKDGRIETVFPSICDPFEDWDGLIHGGHSGLIMRVCAKGYGCLASRDRDYIPHNLCHLCRLETRDATMSDLRRDLFATLDACPNLFFLLLTKRPENVRKMWPETKGPPQKMIDEIYEGKPVVCHPCYRPNVAIIASISDQATAEAMIPPLLECRDLVPVLGVSAEPLLGPVDLTLRNWSKGPPYVQKMAANERYNVLSGEVTTEHGHTFKSSDGPTLDWVIVGGESGKGARPYDIAWPRSIIEQCRVAGVPVFHKQLGSNPIGVNVADSKGGDIDEWPIDLRVREYPEAIGRK